MFKTNNDFEGILLKGVSNEFDWRSLKGFLTQGSFPQYSENSNNEILISEIICFSYRSPLMGWVQASWDCLILEPKHFLNSLKTSGTTLGLRNLQ